MAPQIPTAKQIAQSLARGISLLNNQDELRLLRDSQSLKKSDNERITASEGAGRLPKVQGPQIQIAPPVTSATKITGDRKIE